MLHIFLQNKEKHLEIILHLCTKNLNDMIYSFWQRDRPK